MCIVPKISTLRIGCCRGIVRAMAVTRHFLGWDAPVTDKVVGFLLPDCMTDPPDLDGTITIVPTRQAGRRLREAMALRCSLAGSALLSARVETPAVFARPGLDAAGVASPVRVAMAWAAVLTGMNPDDFRGLFPARPPEQDFGWALRTGEMLQDLREALADGGLLITDVVEKFPHLLEEQDRWNDLFELEQRYLRCLAGAGREDPCSRKIRAALHPELPGKVERIVVAAVPDPSVLMITALERLADDVDVDVLVHAPADLENRFDAFGRPDTKYWKTAIVDIPLPKESVLLAASPAAQSRRVLTLTAKHASDWGPADLAVGVPDRSVIPSLAAELEERGLGAFDPAGRSPETHPVFRLVRALHSLVARGDYADIAAVLRHPDMLSFFRDQHGLSPTGLMRELDDFQNQRMPASFRDFTDCLQSGKPETLHRAVELLGGFRNRLEGDGLCEALRDILRTVYDRREIRHGVPDDDEFAAVADLFDEAIHETGETVAETGHVSNAQAFDLMLRRLGRQVYYTERGDAVIDLEGWLELPWNNAPLLIVTGMNDGFVPDSRMGDLFLPDPLRISLGLRSDESRLARDIFLMTSLIESRRRNGRVYFVAGKTAQNGEPLKPSRLLFRCLDEELRERAELLFGDAGPARDSVPFTMSFRLKPEVFRQGPPVEKLSVTAFRSYLACPFRFYLQHVLGMEEKDDGKTELDAMDFGSLVHYALQGMGEDKGVSGSSDETVLRDFLCARAETWVRNRFGADPPLQLEIQLDAARQRLAAAARRHAALVQEGWETIAWESRREIELNGMQVSGIIDRVDRHSKSGRIRIIDYKTSDTPVTPEKAHVGKADKSTPDFAATMIAGKPARWTDLQLPLYHLLLAADTQLPDDVEIGYFNLPKAVGETGLSLWDGFSSELQSSATACAAGVISAIREGCFWPPAERVVYDDFERILFGDAQAAVEGKTMIR